MTINNNRNRKPWKNEQVTSGSSVTINIINLTIVSPVISKL